MNLDVQFRSAAFRYRPREKSEKERVLRRNNVGSHKRTCRAEHAYRSENLTRPEAAHSAVSGNMHDLSRSVRHKHVKTVDGRRLKPLTARNRAVFIKDVPVAGNGQNPHTRSRILAIFCLFLNVVQSQSMVASKKKTTLNELGEMIDHLVKSSADYATKDDLKNLATKSDVAGLSSKVDGIDTRLQAVEGKVDGINRRLDTEAMARTDEKIPVRVSDLETEVFGKSRAPQHPAR